MRVIFLDHFGVMCLASKHGRIHKKEDMPRGDEMRVHGKFDDFDKMAVETLNSILLETDAEIVVSSDWKRWTTLNEIGEFYVSQGICKKPIGVTPDLEYIDDAKKQRASEIVLWTINNENNIDRWIAIDDMYLKEFDDNNFAWVSRTDQGITQDGIKEKLLKKLMA